MTASPTRSWLGTRRILACALVGVGGLLLTCAALVPVYSVPRIAKIPLDLEATIVGQTPDGQRAEVLDSRSLTSPRSGSAHVDSGVPLVTQRFITVEDPSDLTVATLQAGQTVRRNDKQGDTGMLTATVDRVTINRRTAEPVEDPIGSIQLQGDKPAEGVAHTGLQYRFPHNTKPITYQYFDINARASYDLTFTSQDEINDLWTYHFTQKIAPVDESKVVNSPTNKLSLPAAKWGVPGGQEPVTMTRWYTNQRDLWVEPKTGIIVKEQEQPFWYYGRSAEKPELTVLKANIISDENTVENQIAEAKHAKDKLSLYGRVLPLGLGILGLLALVVGVVIGFRDRGRPPTA